MSAYPWRVWLAFEARPGISIASTLDTSATWRGLAKSCRDADGVMSKAELEYWLDWITDNSHLWGYA